MLNKTLALALSDNFAESFIDNVFKKNVTPEIGSIVYCELVFGIAEHSGVYIGNNKIVQLNGQGEIEAVSPEMFLERLDGFNTAISIYVSCNDEEAVGKKKIAKRAKKMIGEQRNYNLLSDNCHQFTSGCITGDFENGDNDFLNLKEKAESQLDADNWLVWASDGGKYI